MWNGNLVFVEFASQSFYVLCRLSDLRGQTGRISHLRVLFIHIFHLAQSLAAHIYLFKREKKREIGFHRQKTCATQCILFLGDQKSFVNKAQTPVTLRFQLGLVVIAIAIGKTACRKAHLWSTSFCSSLLMSSIFCCKRFLRCSGGRCVKPSASTD